MRLTALIICVALTASLPLTAQQPETLVFRASREIVSIDVVVRDRTGAIVRNLTAADFEVREDGRPQEILTTSFQEVNGSSAQPLELSVLQRLGHPPATVVEAMTTPAAGRRLILLLFDLSSMEPEEVERGVGAALKYVETRMTSADLVAVASLTWELTVLTDFTGDRESIRQVLERLVAVDVSTGNAALTDVGAEVGEAGRPVAATDARLRALRLLAETLTPIAQKKALLYFTGGLANGPQDTPAELRAATTAAARANLAIYPVDTRGLQAVIPSGAARVASRNGEGLFSGRDVNDQFSELTASQDTMASMASATGGRMFSGANDLGEAFTRVQRDTAAYYMLGYSTTNAASDGRFRRVQVRVKNEGLRVEARAGYYGDRDFAHTSRADREAQLEEQLLAPASESALRVNASIAWTRLTADRFNVPITLAGPGIPQAASDGDQVMDVLAIVEDEQGRVVGRVRDTLDVPDEAFRAGAPLLYTTSIVLPPGHFTLKAIVRENLNGAMGMATADIRLPELHAQSLAISAPFLRTKDGSRVLTVDVYDTGQGAGSGILVASVLLFTDSDKALEADLVEVTTPGDQARNARAYELTVPATAVQPGRYTCQITVVDPATGRFATMRTPLDVR